MARLLEISKDLGAAYRAQKEIELVLWKLEQDTNGRKLFLVPEGGWPGKNEAERNLARDRVYAEDEFLCDIAAACEEDKGELADTEARIAELEAERRALEWEIRDRLARSIGEHSDEIHGSFIDASGVDDVLPF